jgi:6-pyruvoyl-tetrahydropterin synthase
MKTTVTVSGSFRASHTHSMCSPTIHGHDWRMSVRAEAGVAMRPFLSMLLAELDLRDLNTMVVGATSTPEGIAAWALERLRGNIPSLVSVTCGFEGYEATCEV